MSDDDIIGTKPTRDQLADLPMFSGTAPPAIRRIIVESASLQGKREAHRKVQPHTKGLRGKIHALLLERGPMHRAAIASELGLRENTVNGRVAELVKAGAAEVVGMDKLTGRTLVAAVRVERPEEA